MNWMLKKYTFDDICNCYWLPDIKTQRVIVNNLKIEKSKHENITKHKLELLRI